MFNYFVCVDFNSVSDFILRLRPKFNHADSAKKGNFLGYDKMYILLITALQLYKRGMTLQNWSRVLTVLCSKNQQRYLMFFDFVTLWHLSEFFNYLQEK